MTLDPSFQLVYLLIRYREQALYFSGVSLIFFWITVTLDNEKAASALEDKRGVYIFIKIYLYYIYNILYYI